MTAAPTSSTDEPAASTRLPASRTIGHTDVPQELSAMMQLAEFLAQADEIVPERFQGKPSNLLAIMLQARALDIPLAIAWGELFVIKGAVGRSARLAHALARRAGHRLRLAESDNRHAMLLIQLAGETDPHEVHYTINDANRLGLTEPHRDKHGNWVKQPANMLIARVTTRAIQRHCPEVLLGLNFGSDDDDDMPAGVPAAAAIAASTERAARVAELLEQAEELMANASTPDVRLKELRELWEECVPVLDEPTADGPTLRQQMLGWMATTSHAADQHRQAATTAPPPPPARTRTPKGRAARTQAPPSPPVTPDGQTSPRTAPCGCLVDTLLAADGAHSPNCQENP